MPSAGPNAGGPDLIEGLCAVLLADGPTAAEVGTAVFDTELAESFDVNMPANAIVIRPHGGPHPDASLQINVTRVQLMTFGATVHLAHVVYVAAYNALKNLTPSVWQGTYIHSCKPQAGPTPYRDATLQWPYLISMWLVTASDIGITS